MRGALDWPASPTAPTADDEHACARAPRHKGRGCVVIDYATKDCLAVTVTPPARGADAVACLTLAVAEAERVLGLGDLRAVRGQAEVLGPAGEVLGTTPAPIAVVTDNGSLDMEASPIPQHLQHDQATPSTRRPNIRVAYIGRDQRETTR